MLNRFHGRAVRGRQEVLLIIDEAQNLSRKVLEEVRLLSGLEAQKEKLLRIIIAGQPELSRKLDSPRLAATHAARAAALSSRCAVEARDARIHRRTGSNVAGANGRAIFSEAACDMVFRYAGGVPRLINVLCDTALLCAFADERTRNRRGPSSRPRPKSCNGSSSPSA